MDPIAIVGLGCLFPGADSPEAFWENLLAARDTTSLATADDMGVDPRLLFDPARGQRDRYATLRGGFVRGFEFEPSGVRVSASRLEGLDPIFPWTLHVALAALADSGYLADEEMLQRCGLVLGNLSFPTRASYRCLGGVYARAVEAGLAARFGFDLVPLDRPGGDAAVTTENLNIVSGPAAVAAEVLGLGGPRFALDAACASSLYAIRLACDRLASREVDLMLAGAVSGADPLFIHMGFSIFQAYPELDGGSRPLDARSSGLVSGQGAGMIALRRYADALRDGDRIHAVIRGVGLSNDGAGRHLLVPNAKGQRLAIERAYADAGLPPSSVAYIECHATGTPIGDATELDSLEAVFAPHGPVPLVGSVKSNFGHLLTAAGIASVIKTTLALSRGVIPPTIRVDRPLASSGGTVGGAGVVVEPTAWPDTGAGGARRGAVSAFGFGGTNAHLILEEFGGPSSERSAVSIAVRSHSKPANTALAIVGMAAHFGPFPDIDSLDAALHAGAQLHGPPPPGRWNGIDARPDLLAAAGIPGVVDGSYLASFELDFLRARIPPDSADRPIPQQLLMFDVADRAARDAGLDPGSAVAVVIGVEAELALHRFRGRVDLDWQIPRLLDRLGVELSAAERQALVDEAKDAIHDPAEVNQYVSFIGNVIAARIASRWDFSGPAFTVSAGELSAFRALEVARGLLDAAGVEAVLVGGVDLAGGLEAVAARVWSGASGAARVGDGAGAVVVRRAADAAAARTRVYATLEGLAIVPPGPRAAAAAAEAALGAAGVHAADIGYLELKGCGVEALDGTELRGLAEVYRSAEPHDGGEATCAVGSAAHVVGDTRAASGIAGVVNAALCLSGRRLPPAPALPEEGSAGLWARTLWHVVPRAHPWLCAEGSQRVAAVSGLGSDGSAAHAVLGEGTAPASGLSLLARRSPLRLVPVCAVDAAALLSSLSAIADELEAGRGRSLEDIAAARVAALRPEAELPLRAVLVGGDPEQVAQQARLALAGVPTAIAAGRRWETPTGSCFTPHPLGEQAGAVAFVYPGAFSAQPGLGGDLLQLFPALHDELAARASDPAGITSERLVRPRARRLPDEDFARAAKVALRGDAVAMIQAGTTHAVTTTAVMRQCFGVVPAAALGYSMGEASMLWAFGVWRAGDEARRRLRASPLFRTQLVGPCEAVAEHAPDGWASVVVAAPAAEVARRVASEARVWMTHLHTPREVVLGGNALDVRRVVELLLAETPGAEAFPAPVRSAIHCAAMAGTHQALFELHRLPVVDRPPFRFYSAADYGPTALEPDRLAQNLADATTRPVDFVRLVERSWEDGARVFVELGPGAACSRWIGEILSGRAHAALSVSGRGVDEATALVRAVARLVAERVPLRLDAFAGAAQVAPPATRSAVRTVQVGGRDLVPFGPRQERRSAPVFGKTELLAFAGGRIAEAFGPAYAPIDGYRRRVRLPLPPYLLVSRVTALTGHRGVFEPCAVTTEYDVPHGAFYSVDGQVPLAVAVESGQCDLLLISYLGVDFDSRGDRVYRLLDCTLTFLDELPMEGDTLRYEIRIDSFARTGATLLFFFAYDCYVGDRRILEMRGGCAGFFTDAELAEGRGVIDSPDYLAARARAQAAVFDAPLRCGRSSFDSEDLRRLAAGDLAACFGPEHALGGANPSLRLPPEAMRMVDRVVRIDSNGGAWGLGLLEAEKDLAPGDWYFPCHFQGDEVLAGSLMADGCSQLLQLYLLYLGLHANTLDARFQPVAGVSQRVICRGQVTPEGRLLAYRLEITALEGGARPSARANCDIVVDGRTVVRFTDLAVELAEKAVTRTPVLYDERQVRAFTIGSVAACFGPEFARFDAPGRRVPRSPNGDLQLVSRVLDASARGPRPEPGAWLVSEYEMPRDPWFTRANGYPVTPYSILMEIALQPCGFLSAHQGTSFVFPDSDLYFRNLDGSGFLHREIDLRGRTLRNRVVLTSTTSLSGVILQKFTYALECEAEALFDGNAAFGYFEAAALGQQAGLDGGRCVPTWLAEAGVPAGWAELGDGHRLIDARPGRPHERLAAARLHLLDRAAVIPGGGRHGLGYVLAEKAVDPSSWFFACHFHHDPVMPGSLGVETIVEAFQYLIMNMGLTDGFRSPRFGHVSGSRTVWKYRGQVLADARSIAVEVHVTGVEEWHGTRVVKADASLWRDGLRIYELTDLAQSVSEAGNERQRPLVERFAGAGEQ